MKEFEFANIPFKGVAVVNNNNDQYKCDCIFEKDKLNTPVDFINNVYEIYSDSETKQLTVDPKNLEIWYIMNENIDINTFQIYLDYYGGVSNSFYIREDDLNA